jgi:stalled ribosome alternative rescue factor ArfA
MVVMKIRRVNPVAKAVARNRPRTQVIPNKKGKGSYNRKKGREDAVSVTISKDAYNKINNTET